MLIYIDPAMLVKPEWQSLKKFLRNPFSEESCQRVDAQLPQLARAYRAMAQTRGTWVGGLPASQVGNANDVFKQTAAIGRRRLPLVPEETVMAQIVLLEEVLRDDAALNHKRTGSQDKVMLDRPMPRLDAGASRVALQATALHEAAFLALAGLFEIRRNGRLIEFTLTPLGIECLRNRLVTATMQKQTEAMLRQELLSIVANLRRTDQHGTSSITTLLSGAVLDQLEERFLDCFFSLGAQLRRDAKVAPLIAGARGLCRWFAVLELVRLAGEMTLLPSRELFSRLHMDPGLLEAVLQERASALPSDKGGYRGASGTLSVGASKLSHAIHCCKGAVLSSNQARQLGKEFEHQISAYIRERVARTDYVVRRGVKRSENGAGEMYDADLIIYDAGRRQIFFVQAKWKRDSRTASLDDELHDWGADNSPLTKGVKRLAALRARLSEPVVLGQVRAALDDIKLSDEHILANSHFIVLHTLPSFNAYLIDGVAIYEWNLFRNLLRRGVVDRVFSPDDIPGDAVRMPPCVNDRILPLEDPQEVLDYYCATIGAEPALLAAAMRIRQDARYGFDIAWPQTSWWERVTKRRTIRIVRPYV